VPESKPFFVADLNAKGELHSQEKYLYDQLQLIPGAADLIAQFSTAIWRSPEEFDIHLVTSGIKFRWFACAPTAGIATIRSGENLASLSLLCTGLNEDADRLTLDAFQKHLLAELRDTGYEPAFALMDLKDRPLVATINFRDPNTQQDQLIAALADRCFAASYFRYHGLA
jgi:hypothetical protein